MTIGGGNMSPSAASAGGESLRGVGLFTGAPASVSLAPARRSAGIVFVRADLPGQPAIPALAEHVVPAARNTTLALDPSRDRAEDPRSVCVRTVEHLLAALAGLGVRDAIVRVEGPEIPLADGSAAAFVDLVRRSGLHAADDGSPGAGGAASAALRESIVVQDDQAGAVLRYDPPHPGDAPGALVVEYRLSYPGVKDEWARCVLVGSASAESFGREIAPARTFCTVDEALALQASGRFGHVGTGQVLVLGAAAAEGGAERLPAEAARHKVLDLIGDLALTGVGLSGRVLGERSGHRHTHDLARRIRAALGLLRV